MAENKAGIYANNYKQLSKATYAVGEFPGFRHEYVWPLHVDVMLLFSKYFNNEYTLKGKEKRILDQFQQVSVKKFVKISTIYSPWKIIQKSRLNSLYKAGSDKMARLWQYGNKFFPLDQESLHILANFALEETLICPVTVVNLSELTSNELGGYLGRKREVNVFNFLGVQKVGPREKLPVKKTDGDGKKLTGHELDLFRGTPDKDSEDVGFKNVEVAKKGIEKLADDDRAHQVRASLLMIQRAKGALANVKDPEKKKNLKAGLKMWQAYKDKIVDK